MSTISAGTTSTTAFRVTSDTTGSLLLKTGASGATAIDIDAAQVVSIGNIAVTGGTVNNTIIGGTTAAAGSFTTLSAASTVTFNGGTANGVAYLNGSKNLTTGSALVFDGSNLGIGTSSPADTLDVNGTIRLGNAELKFGGTTATIFGSSSLNQLRFYTNNTERLRIDSSGNLGLGTTSPAVRLDVQTASAVGGITLTATTGTNGAAINCVNTGGSSYFGRNNSSGGAFGGAAYATVVYGGGAYPMSFYTNDTERMRLDSSGNLGIGTTSPGALLHTYTATQESVRFARNSTASSAYVTFYANNSSSAQVQYAGILGDVASSTAGSHGGNLLFYTTGSGTSAERARITSDGNFVVGTTSSSRRLQASFSSSTAYSSSSMETTSLLARFVNPDGTVGNYAGIHFATSNNSDAAIAGVRTADASMALTFGTRNVGSGNIVERARITSAGAFFGALSVGSGSSAGGLFTASQNAMMSKYADSGSTPSVTFNLNYEQATNGWETGTLMIYASATQNVLTGNTGAWWFYHVAHFSSTFGLYLADSGGNTGGFSISAGSVASGAGTKSASLTITTTGTQTYLSVQVFFSNPYGVYSIT